MCNKFCTIGYFKYSGNQAPFLWGTTGHWVHVWVQYKWTPLGFTFHLGICSTVVWYNALRHVRLFIFSTEGKLEVDNSLKKLGKLRLIKKKGQRDCWYSVFAYLLLRKVKVWEGTRVSVHSFTTWWWWLQWETPEAVGVSGQTFLLAAVEMQFSSRGSRGRCGWGRGTTLSVPAAVARRWFGSLCLCCVCVPRAQSPATSSSSQPSVNRQGSHGADDQCKEFVFTSFRQAVAGNFPHVRLGPLSAASKQRHADWLPTRSVPALPCLGGAPRGSRLFSPRVWAVSCVHSVVYPQNWRASGGIQLGASPR